MKYREEVERESLGEEGKNRVCASIVQRLAARQRRSLIWKRVLAVGLSVVLVCAVAVPTAVLLTGEDRNMAGADSESELPESFGGNEGGDNQGSDKNPSGGNQSGGGNEGQAEPPNEGWVDLGEDIEPCPYSPDGIVGGFRGMYHVFYGAEEPVALICKVVTGHEITDVAEEESGFEFVSVKRISAKPNTAGFFMEKDGETIPWTEYTYQVEIKVGGAGQTVGGGEQFFAKLHFKTDNGLESVCGFYGYRPGEGKHAGRVFYSHLSADSAFRAYLDYMLNAGEITRGKYDELLAEYDRSSGSRLPS